MQTGVDAILYITGYVSFFVVKPKATVIEGRGVTTHKATAHPQGPLRLVVFPSLS